MVRRAHVETAAFNQDLSLPYSLRITDFEYAMENVYAFFFDVNTFLARKGLARLEEMLRPATMSGIVSDMIAASLAKASRTLVENKYHNGHPDLILRNHYPQDSVKSGEHGVEIKTTRKAGGAVDMHGARAQWMCVFVYRTDNVSEPAMDREAMRFTEVYLGQVTQADFRKNPRGDLGTRTATLDRQGIAKLRQGWVYRTG